MASERAHLFPRSGYYFLALFGVALIAFWPVYFSRLPSGPEYYVHLHTLGVVLWILLLISQPFLIAQRRWALHRRLGKLSLLLAPYIAISSLLLAHSRIGLLPDDVFAREGNALYLPLAAILLFLVSYALAMYHRASAPLHARYMIGTALPMFDPVVARLLFFYTHIPPGPVLYPAIGYGLTDLALLILIWADRRQPKGREAFRYLLAIFVTVHLGWFTLAQTQPWFRFAAWFRDLPFS